MTERAAVQAKTPTAAPTQLKAVARAQFGLVQRKCGCGAAASISGECKDCQDKTLSLQTKRSGAPILSHDGGGHGAIKVGEANDAYEQEADHLAALVMRMPAQAALDAHRNPVDDADPSMLFRRVTPLVQRHALQRHSGVPNPKVTPPSVLDDEERTSGTTPVVEDEASENAMAEFASQLLQRQTLATGHSMAADPSNAEAAHIDENVIEAAHPAGEARFDDSLAAEQTTGRPLPPELRAFMEPRFGVDFGHVRVHTGPRAAKLAAAVQAQAFTLGTDIYFGANYYAPADLAGRQLIAHELVHTLQQNPQRLAPRRIQRQKTFVPERVPRGTLIHETVLPAFGEANPKLFTEVAIPGATSKDVDTGKTGVADFYLGSTTVALAMPSGEPALLEANSRLRQGKEEWNKKKHEAEGAPLGPKKGSGCGGPGSPAKICKLGAGAPSKILLGDLKPASTPEVLLGGAQLKNYEQGLAKTRDDANAFIKTPNEDRGDPKGSSWTLETGRIDSLKIPKDFAIGNKKQNLEGLRLYEGRKQGDLIPGLKGRMAVYKPPDDKSGIWVYEWIPTDLPADVKKGKPSKDFTDALNRVDELIKRLRPSKKKGMKKALDGAAAGRARASGKQVIQRKPEPFDHATWQKDYTTWHDDSKKIVASDKAREPKVIAALLEVQDRTKQPLGVTPQQTQAAKGLDRVERWITWGGVFGRFRKVFGGIFIKVTDLYEKAREKLHKLREKTTAKGDGGGDRLVGAIFKTAFKTAMVFMRLITDRVADRLKAALEKGIDKLIEEYFSDTYIDKLVAAKDDLEKKVALVEKAIEEDIQARVDAIVKPYEDKLDFIADIAKWLGNISKIVRAVRWAARVVQCLTPPGIGCLKLLLQEAAEHALEMVVETCWFQKYVVGKIFSKLEFFQKLPKNISDFILDHVKAWLPLDAGLKERMFPKDMVVSDKLDTKSLACDDEHLKREHIELRKLYDDHPDKIKLLLKLMEKSGVGEKKELTLDMIRQMDAVMKSLSVDQLNEALKNIDPSKGTGVGQLDDLANSIKGIKPGGGGGGGGEPDKDAKPGKKPKHQVVVNPAANVKFDGAANEPPDPKTSIGMSGTSKDHAEKSTPSITISLFRDGELISQVTAIPTIVGKPREETIEGVRYKVVPYKLQQGIVFKHTVKEAGEFRYGKGTVLHDRFELGTTK